MKTEQEQLNDMYARVRQVFPQELIDTFAPQQETLADNAIDRVLKKDGPQALTVERLQGIKELVTQHLWSGALTEASKKLPTAAMATSETSDSPQTKSADSGTGLQKSAYQLDLQNLPEDPVLGAIRAMQSRLTEQSIEDEKADGEYRIAKFLHGNPEKMREVLAKVRKKGG